LSAHYEQLRQDAMRQSISGGRGLGLALFLRSGMTTWMQAWSECASFETETHSPSGGNERRETIPVDLRSQVTSLLAGMILSLQQEASQ
jgi:hypothetical protein